MGCYYYKLYGGADAHFLEDSEFGCLCTFPHNDGEELTAHRVRSLALLGAAIAIAANEPTSREFVFIPSDLPRWIVDGIRRIVPDREGE